jgi:hypothetical protein
MYWDECTVWTPRGPTVELALPIGRYVFRIDAEDRGYLPREIEIESVLGGDDSAPIEVALVRGGSVEVEWEAPDGSNSRPPRTVVVLLREEEWDAIEGPVARGRENTTWNDEFVRVDYDCLRTRSLEMLSGGPSDERGVQTFVALPPGRYRWKTIPGGVTLEPETIDVDRVETIRRRVAWSESEP